MSPRVVEMTTSGFAGFSISALTWRPSSSTLTVGETGAAGSNAGAVVVGTGAAGVGASAARAKPVASPHKRLHARYLR
jgi:hypothetical protein